MDLYDKKVVLKHILHATPYKTETEMYFWNVINSLPTLSPSSLVNRGRWIGEVDMSTGHAMQECSVCHKVRTVDNFCGNCGAIMEDKEDL